MISPELQFQAAMVVDAEQEDDPPRLSSLLADDPAFAHHAGPRSGAGVAGCGGAASKTASWVIRNKTTKEVILETFDARRVQALNTAKYEAIPVHEYLAGLNASLRPMLSGDSVAAMDSTMGAL